MKVFELQKLLNAIDNEQKEMMILLGKDRYETVVKEIREVLVRNGLNEHTSYSMINHLNDIFRVELIRV